MKWFECYGFCLNSDIYFVNSIRGFAYLKDTRELLCSETEYANLLRF